MLTRFDLSRRGRLRRRRFRCLRDGMVLALALPPPSGGDERGAEIGVDIVLLDRRGRLVALAHVVDLSDAEVPRLVHTVASHTPRGLLGLLLGSWQLLMVSRRPEEPDDVSVLELAWEEAAATAGASRLKLLNWLLVVEGRQVFSVAEFAPSRPLWPARDPTATRASS